MLKKIILLAVLACCPMANAKPLIITPEVSDALTGLTWNLTDSLHIYWDDGCRIHESTWTVQKTCTPPEFGVYDWNDPNKTFLLEIGGLPITAKTSAKDSQSLFSALMEKGSLDANITELASQFYPLTDRKREVRKLTVELLFTEEVFEQYQNYSDTYLKKKRNDLYANYYKWFVLFAAGLCLIWYVLIPQSRNALAWLLSAIRSHREQRENRRRQILKERIEEVETIRKEVREKLYQEEQ